MGIHREHWGSGDSPAPKPPTPSQQRELSGLRVNTLAPSHLRKGKGGKGSKPKEHEKLIGF